MAEGAGEKLVWRLKFGVWRLALIVMFTVYGLLFCLGPRRHEGTKFHEDFSQEVTPLLVFYAFVDVVTNRKIRSLSPTLSKGEGILMPKSGFLFFLDAFVSVFTNKDFNGIIFFRLNKSFL